MIFDRDGKPILAYGSPGGSTIINSVVNVTLNLIDHGMTLQEAIDAPRLSVDLSWRQRQRRQRRAGQPFVRSTPASLHGLRALGHTVDASSDIGSVQARGRRCRRPASSTAPPTRGARAR